MSQKQVVITPGGRVRLYFGSLAAFSLAVPTGKRWKILSFVADWTASATVGNRVIHAVIIGGGGAQNIWRGASSGVTTASQVCGYDIGFGSPLNTPSTTVRRNIANTANTNVQVRENTSINMMIAGDIITLTDIAAVDANDVVTYRVLVEEYEA